MMNDGPTALLKPAANEILQRWPVSKRVNSSRARDDDPTLTSPSARCRRAMNVSRGPGDVRHALRESEPDFIVMTPPHISVHDPILFRDAQFDLVRNVDRIKNDDPRAPS